MEVGMCTQELSGLCKFIRENYTSNFTKKDMEAIQRRATKVYFSEGEYLVVLGKIYHNKEDKDAILLVVTAKELTRFQWYRIYQAKFKDLFNGRILTGSRPRMYKNHLVYLDGNTYQFIDKCIKE